jgi:hypothetical protein
MLDGSDIAEGIGYQRRELAAGAILAPLWTAAVCREVQSWTGEHLYSSVFSIYLEEWV